MTKTLRLGLVAASGFAALAFASVAMAAYSPTLTLRDEVTATGADTVVGYAQTDADDPLAHLQILSPAGYTVNLAQAPGTQIGTLDGHVKVGELGGVTVPVTGTVTVGDPGNATLQAVAHQCTGANASVIWLLSVTAGGNALPNPIPVFVNPITSGMTAAFASASIELCLPPPPLADLQIKLFDAALHLTGVFTPPSTPGEHRWTAANTPYAADNSVNLLGTVETQAIESTPVEGTFSAKRITKKRTVKHKAFTDIFYSYSAKLSGTLTAAGQAVADATVDIMSGATKLGSATTDSNGAFSATLKLTKTTEFHVVYSRDGTPLVGATCIPPLPLGPTMMPCASVTNAGMTVVSGGKTVVKPKLTHKRIKHKKKPKKKHHH